VRAGLTEAELEDVMIIFVHVGCAAHAAAAATKVDLAVFGKSPINSSNGESDRV